MSLLVVRVKFDPESSSSHESSSIPSQVRVRFRFFCFLFPFASLFSLSKAVIVILPFIMMSQLMFGALNMKEILLSTRSREFIVGSKLTAVIIHSRHLYSRKGFVQCCW